METTYLLCLLFLKKIEHLADIAKRDRTAIGGHRHGYGWWFNGRNTQRLDGPLARASDSSRRSGDALLQGE